MDKQQLTQQIEHMRIIGTDTQNIEVKSNVGKSTAETLSAFSNTTGGLLIIGLSEKDGFTPVEGFQARQQQDKLVSECGKLTPVVRPTISLVEFEGSVIICAEIAEMRANEKPCYVTTAGRYGGSFRRSGEGDHKLEKYEVDRILDEQTQPKWDEEAIADATTDDLDQETLNAFLKQEKANRPKTFAQGIDVAQKRLRITKDKSPTLAALLTFGEYPQEFFPRLTVTFSVFPGTQKGDITKGERLLDSRTFVGPIPELVEQAVAAVKTNMRTAAFIGDVQRKNLPDYPLIAVREAVVNALMHRDYSPDSRGTQVQVNMFVDRLEITSPGGLFGGVRRDDLGKAGISSSRNQRLSVLLESAVFPNGDAVAENRGTGIAVMQNALAEALMPEVEIYPNLVSFTVIFRRRRVAPKERHGTAVDQVRATLGDHESLSTTELVSRIGLSRTAIQKALNQLIGTGEVEPTEPPRSPKQRYRRLT